MAPTNEGRPVATARVLRGLADPTRLALLMALGTSERSVGDLVTTLGIPQPKVSTHLAVLHACGLVERRRSHRHVLYGVADDRVHALVRTAAELGDRPPTEPPAHRPPPRPEGATGTYLVVIVAGEPYALPIGQVREVVPYRTPRRVPGGAASQLGILEVRGRVVAVHDLATCLGVASGERRSLVLTAAREGRDLALAVERLAGVREIEAGSIQARGRAGSLTEAFATTADGIVVILDADALPGAAPDASDGPSVRQSPP